MSEPLSGQVGFRAATVADSAAVAAVHVRSWRESFKGVVPQTFLDGMSVERRTEAFKKRFPEESYRMFVAETKERGVVGFADFGAAREAVEGYEGELYAIYMLPEFQRRGVGSRLFKLGAEFLKSRGKRSMYLLALEVSPYRSFHERMGGRVIGRTQIEIEGEPFDELYYGWRTLP